MIGVDDTDVVGSPGTGRLARRLAERVELAGFGRPLGVTRHQLFEGSGVPKTSRNSAAAIALAGADPVGSGRFAVEFLLQEHAPGSDPGLALLRGEPARSLVDFARRIQRELVERDEARRVAAAAGVRLMGLAGTQDGVIGALAAAALRADGDDGRFVGLPGIRELPERVTVDALLASSGVEEVIDEETGTPLDGSVDLIIGSWVRPRVVGGRPVIVARLRRGRWVNADARPARV